MEKADRERNVTLMAGEIHTGLLQNSTAVPAPVAAEILDLLPGQDVRSWERPIRQAASAPQLTGVDCLLPSAGKAARCVGTVSSELWITGGHVLQNVVTAGILRSPQRRRLGWSHYLTHPGELELVTGTASDDLVHGLLGQERASSMLDLGSIAARGMTTVQQSPLLDRLPPFRPERTILRWTARIADPPANGAPAPDETPGTSLFSIENRTLRTIRLEVPEHAAAGVPALCQDLARHDWLLTALTAIVDLARSAGTRRNDVVRQLRPAIDHLMFAWMPATRLPPGLADLRHEIDRTAGLTRQWEASVGQIRDQISLAIAEQVGRPGPSIVLPSAAAAGRRS